MPFPGLKEGFVGEKVFRLSHDQIRSAEEDSVFNGLYVTDIGYFPNAGNHLVDRLDTPLRETILICCIGGEGWFEVNGERYAVAPSEFVVIPAGTPHRYGSSSGWQVYWVHFGGQSSDGILHKLGGVFDSPLTGPDMSGVAELFEKMIRRAEAGLTKASVDFLHFSVWHLLGLVILGVAQPAQAGTINARMDACIHFMKEHVSASLTLQEMAEHAGYSVSHFSQLFRDRTGYSPMDFYIQIRIQHAAKILSTTTYKVLDVARYCGYENPYYFSRIFHRVTGYSPKVYRQRFRV